jgi:hypothetical protein
MKIRNVLVIGLLIFSHWALAQNARFSQIGTAPMQFNPSLAGRFDGKARLNSLYSIQQSDIADMQHQYVSFDIKFGPYRNSGDDQVITDETKITKEGKDKIVKNKGFGFPGGYWAVGLNYYHYGNPKGPLSASFYSATIARHFYNKSNKFYGFGLQGTYAQGNLNENDGLSYDREISGGTFQYPRRTPANYNTSKTYVDFNAGGYYGMVTDAVMFELGGAMYHLFYPQNDIYNKDSETKLRHRITAHSVLRLKLNNKWGVVQKNMYWQEGMYIRSQSLIPKDSTDREITAFWSGLEFVKVNPSKNINVNFGFYTRSFRTAMPYLNVNFGKYANLRYSYEHPLNPKKFNAYSAKRHEIGVILSYKRHTAPGTKFYRKTNFW